MLNFIKRLFKKCIYCGGKTHILDSDDGRILWCGKCGRKQ